MRTLIAALFALLLAAPATAQQFPTIRDHTVIGRIGTGSGTGPSHEIPFANLGPFIFQTITGDCVVTAPLGVLSITCTKTNGVPFVASATTDTTNATNIGSGTLANARLAGTQNTVKGAATSAVEADLALPSCSTASSVLQWTTNTGFGCGSLTAGLWQLFGNAAVSDPSFPNVAMDMTVSAVTLYNPVTNLTITQPGATAIITGINAGPGATFRDVGGVDTVTITIASPAVITDNVRAETNGNQVVFTTTGALPTGIVSGTTYFVINASGNTYQISATLGGSAINTSGSQSGTQTATYGAYTVGQTANFYWIWGAGPGLSTINSARAPMQQNGGGTTGPILPAGYTHYAFAFPLIISDNSTLQHIVVSASRSTTTIMGNRAFYNGSLSRDFSNYFNAGANCGAAAFKIVDYSTMVPLGATTVNVLIDSELHNGAATFLGGFVARWGNSTCDNNNDLNLSLYVPVASFVAAMDQTVDIPVNSSRAFWGVYLFSSGSIVSSDTNMFFRGYSW